MIQEYLAHSFEKDPNDQFDLEYTNRLRPVLQDFQSANANPPASSRWLFSDSPVSAWHCRSTISDFLQSLVEKRIDSHFDKSVSGWFLILRWGTVLSQILLFLAVRFLFAMAVPVLVLGLTALLALTGGAMNPFTFLYLVHVVVGAILLPRGMAWSLAAFSSACYGGFIWPGLNLSLIADQSICHTVVLSPEMRLHLQGMWRGQEGESTHWF